jgi:hypothetical protein
VTDGRVRVSGASLGLDQFGDLEPIGQGAHSVVYRTYVTDHARFVAVKVVHVDVAAGAEGPALTREAEALAAVADHPHIVTLHHVGTTAWGQPYLVMDYWPEGSYADLLGATGSLPVPAVLDIGVRLSGALETAHQAGFRHRDIKPENILVTDHGPALCDFGIAGVGERTHTVTAQATEMVHTAPESPDHRFASDVYSLASTLYTLLEGRPPIGSATDGGPVALMDRIRQLPPRPMGPNIPDDLATALLGALGKDPDARRPGRAMELGTALQLVQHRLGLPVTELTAPNVEPSGPRIEMLDATTGSVRSMPAPPTAAPPSSDAGTTASGRAPRRIVAARIALATLLAVLVGLVVTRLGDSDTSEPSRAAVVRSVAIAPPVVGAAASSGGAAVARPGAPTDVRVDWVSQARAHLTWVDHSSVENGYVVELATFPVNPSTGRPASHTAAREFVGADGVRPDADGLTALPPNTEAVDLQLDDLTVFTCARVVATASSGITPSAGQVCFPEPPQPPDWTYAPVQDAAAGPLTLRWTDRSFDEAGFTIYEVDPVTGRVLTFLGASAGAESATWPDELRPGERRCFTITASNAAQTIPMAKGAPLRLPQASFRTACFDVVPPHP